MTEQQPKILQIIDIVHTPPTADIVQMPESTDTRHLADGSPDGRHSAAQTSPGRKPILGVSRMERIQESRLTILERWHSPYESLHLDQWKALCTMSDVIDDLLTRVIEKEPVDWRYYIGDDVFVTIRHRFPSFTSEGTLFPPVNGPTTLPREVWLYTLENGKNYKKQSHCWKKETQNWHN